MSEIGKIPGVPKKFTKPGCMQCNMINRFADKNNLRSLNTTNLSQEEVDAYLAENTVDYEEIDISLDDKALSFVKELGYMSAPVVWDPRSGESFQGFQVDSLKGMLLPA